MRDYQKECVEIIENNFKKFDRQLIQLPTGAGKTWIFSQFLEKNANSALIVCPSIELKEQIIDTLKRFNIKDVSSNVCDKKNFHVVTAQSLGHKKNLDGVRSRTYDYIVIDEAHHAQSYTYINLFNFLEYKPKVLGCTATPERLDGKSLLEIFHRLTYEKNIYDLIDQGFLADLEAYRIKTGQSISKRSSSDFRAIELKQLDNDTRNRIILKTFMDNCTKLKTLIFCLNVDHSIKISDLLNKEGVKAAYIHGKMNKSERRNILKKFKSGEIMALTNCQILTEGFDEPSIEALLITRPTASKSLYCQMVGRGLRKTETKSICKLYEVTDNNFKLCTFNVACGSDETNQEDYKPGIRLTERTRELKSDLKIRLDDFEIKKESFDLFLNQNKLKGNAFVLLKSKFYEYKITDYQKFWLDFYEIKHPLDINFLEAAFLIWKEEIKEKYGYNTRS